MRLFYVFSSPSRVSYLHPLASPRLFSHACFTFPSFLPLPNAFLFPPLYLFHPSFLFPRALLRLTFARLFGRPYLHPSARIFSCDHFFLVRDSLVSILARPQASLIPHQSSSYQCFSSLMEGLFKTPWFIQCELQVDINSGIV